MTFTYDPDAWPAGVPPALEAIRLRIGDTDRRQVELQDEEIEYLLATYPSVSRASLEAARRILARLSRQSDASGAGLTANRSQRFQQLTDLLVELEAEVARAGRPLYVGSGYESSWRQGR